MFKHSFFTKQFRKTNEEIIEFLKTTDKPIKYTYGYKYRKPTTCLKPITLEEAIQIVRSQSLLDVDERDDFIDMNAYDGNDMW